jgi:molybdate transport system substrate-binding protein
MRRILYALLFVFVSMLARAETIHVFAAASLTEALKKIGANFETERGHKVLFNFGASSLLARQIQEGAPADLFFSADENNMRQVEMKGLLEPGTRKDLLSNTLVIVVRNDNEIQISRPEDLTKVRRLALGETRTVPAGVYARKYLEARNLWSSLQPKVVPTDNVRAALAAVELGNVDAAIVYKTDALISRKVRITFEVPHSESPVILYPAAVLRESRKKVAAQDFLAYLQSLAAFKDFETAGFQPVRQPAIRP